MVTATRNRQPVKMSINEVFGMDDEYQKFLQIEAWVEEADGLEDETVLVKTSDGKELKTTAVAGGKTIIFGINGRRMKRRLAAGLVYNYGEHGRYRGTDQTTGYAPVQWAREKAGVNKDIAAALTVEMEAAGTWTRGEPNFLRNYLYIVEPGAVTDAEDLTAVEAPQE